MKTCPQPRFHLILVPGSHAELQSRPTRAACIKRRSLCQFGDGCRRRQKFSAAIGPAFQFDLAFRQPFRPDQDIWGHNTKHWLFRISYKSRSYVGFYSQGGLIESPKAGMLDVLDSLQCDCRIGNMTYYEVKEEISPDYSHRLYQDCRNACENMQSTLGMEAYRAFISTEMELG